MARGSATTSGEGSGEKKARKSPGARPVFVVFQVLDEAGNPTAFPKERINLITTTRDAAQALEVMDGGEYPHATYKKTLVASKAV